MVFVRNDCQSFHEHVNIIIYIYTVLRNFYLYRVEISSNLCQGFFLFPFACIQQNQEDI